MQYFRTDMQFMEDVHYFDGTSTSYCCLCKEHVSPDKVIGHNRESKHKAILALTNKDQEIPEDAYVIKKSELLSPTETEFMAVKDIVLSCEKALKLVSDNFNKSSSEEETKDKENIEDSANKMEEAGATGDSTKEEVETEPVKPRLIKGVMRAGLLANGLLMTKELEARLVLIVSEKPTAQLLEKIAEVLFEQLGKVTEKVYKVEAFKRDAYIKVVSQEKPPCAVCRINVTSTNSRLHPFKYYNEIGPADPPGMLPRVYLEESLQALRRARWFESKVYPLSHCESVMRVLRDMCINDPTWNLIDDWTLQQIVHKCMSTADAGSQTPGAILQRFLECVSSGILLVDGPGLYDPCEREPTDLCDKFTNQQRQDITVLAQKQLRMMAFGDLYKILNLDFKIPSSSSDAKTSSTQSKTPQDVPKRKFSENATEGK